MNSKEQFFKEEYISLLKQLSDNEVGLWGVLTPQGMIEHMTDAFGNAQGRVQLPLQTPETILPKMRAFALSETNPTDAMASNKITNVFFIDRGI